MSDHNEGRKKEGGEGGPCEGKKKKRISPHLEKEGRGRRTLNRCSQEKGGKKFSQDIIGEGQQLFVTYSKRGRKKKRGVL